MKNYYDELEVSKTASKEVIEKVYKVLAKKYHPDTTQEADKKSAEEKFKIISEAYEVLSDDAKREKYNLELEQSNPSISYEEYINIVNERDSLNYSLTNLKNELHQLKNSNTTNYNINNHIPYNQVYNNNSNNNSNNNYTNTRNYQNPSNPNNYNNSQKKQYYYTNTGKPASVFAYYKYKLKEFFSNIALLFLSIIVIILALNAFLGSNLFSLFFNK